MNELAQLVPGDIDFSILASLFGSQSEFPFIEILFIVGSMAPPIVFMCFENKEAWQRYGFFNIVGQCFGRVALDIGLVIGICGSAIGVVVMTLSPQVDYMRTTSIVLLNMLWGGIFVGLGYFLHNPAIAIKARISKWGVCFSLFFAVGGFFFLIDSTQLEYVSTFLLPIFSEAFVPYFVPRGVDLDRPVVPVSSTCLGLVAARSGI